MTGFGYNTNGFGAYPNRTGEEKWRIIMHTNNNKSNFGATGLTAAVREKYFGYYGTSAWNSITAASTDANTRTRFGDGVGLYDAYFTMNGITKLAIVDGTGDLVDVTTHTNRRVYTLYNTCTTNINAILQNIDSRMKSNSWQANDTIFGSNSSVDPVAGSATSGYLSDTGASSGFLDNTNSVPSSFAIWGINRDSDNDTQVLCAYSGNLQSGKADAWRGSDPHTTLWSYWGNDFHSLSATQTISASTQSNAGVADGVNFPVTTDVYLIAYAP